MKLLAIALLMISTAFADAARDARWREDLDMVAVELPRRHPNLFFKTPRSVFDQAVADLRNDIPSLSDPEIMVGLARLAALPGDAHTNLFLTQRNASFRLLPLQLRWFDDGLFVIGTSADYQRAAGAKVVRIGGTPAEQVYQAVARLISYENESWVRETSPDYLINADILAALKIVPDDLSVPFEFQDLSGNVFTIDVPSSTPNIPAPILPYPDPAGGYVPLYQRQRTLNYWFTYIESSRTLYFAYNQCAQMTTLPFPQFNAQLWATFNSKLVERIVIDLRNNTGGDSSVLTPFIASGFDRATLLADMRPYVIVGRRTFSSAVLNAVQMRHGPVRLLGEPTGGNPNAYGEVQSFILPNSRLNVNYSTKYFSLVGVADGPVLPDIAVPTTSADYFARHDPYLAAVLADATSTPVPAPGEVTVVNAASFRLGPVAPGSVASAFGSWTDATQLFANDAAAQLIAVRPGQINFQVPAATPIGAASARVVQNGATVASGVFEVAATAPALFPGAAIVEDRSLRLYGTGQGDGGLPVRVYLGAELAAVSYSGSQPSVPGLWQIDVSIPGAVADGQTPVFVAIGGRASNGVTVQVGK
jgi:uncharacterized protein (TIGR03437 family)